MRRLIRLISSITIVLGVLLLADAAITLVWQEPISAVIAMIKRDHINKRFLSYRTAPLSAADKRKLQALDERRRMAFLARREER
jgi:sortase A